MSSPVHMYDSQYVTLGISDEDRRRLFNVFAFPEEMEVASYFVPEYLRGLEAFSLSDYVTNSEFWGFYNSLPASITRSHLFSVDGVARRDAKQYSDDPVTGVNFWLARLYCLSNGGDLPSLEEVSLHQRSVLKRFTNDLPMYSKSMHDKARKCLAFGDDYFSYWLQEVGDELGQLGFGLFSEYTRSICCPTNLPKAFKKAPVTFVPNSDFVDIVVVCASALYDIIYPGFFMPEEVRDVYDGEGVYGSSLAAFRVAYFLPRDSHLEELD